jgi:hypothetical protein
VARRNREQAGCSRFSWRPAEVKDGSDENVRTRA